MEWSQREIHNFPFVSICFDNSNYFSVSYSYAIRKIVLWLWHKRYCFSVFQKIPRKITISWGILSTSTVSNMLKKILDWCPQQIYTILNCKTHIEKKMSSINMKLFTGYQPEHSLNVLNYICNWMKF